MNNSLINMSDYQKIIFVKDLDESSLGIGEIEKLSKTYPFAVFLTTNKSELHASNIWNDGERLTRFIGVDQEHNKINVGGHSLRLMFDYNTGKIGIYDDNSLKSISITRISWTDITNKEQVCTYTESSLVNVPDIDSRNNKFSITYKFTIDESIDGSSSAENVSNVLKVYGNNSSIVTNDYTLDYVNVESKSDLPKSIYYTYTYQINRDTIVADYFGTYIAVSEYASDVKCQHNMRMYLNPIDYTVTATVAETGESILFTRNVNLKKGITLNLTINFTPNNINSYERSAIDLRHIYVSISSSNPEYVSLSASELLAQKDTDNIYNSTVKANLFVSNNIEVNSSKNIDLTFKVLYRKNNKNISNEFNYLSKTFTLSINGDNTENFIYYGYEDPTSISFNKSKLISFADKIPGDDVLYDWETDTVIKEFNHSNYKYIAIPQKYAASIKPRLDAYVIDTLSGINRYIDNSNAFDIIARNKEIANTGIEFIVYRSKSILHNNVYNEIPRNAFYFGKIQ